MKKTSGKMRAVLLTVMALTAFLLAACRQDENANDMTDAVKSIIELRIESGDFDGAAAVLDNCDEGMFTDEQMSSMKDYIASSAAEYVSGKVDSIIETDGYKAAYEYLDGELPEILDDESVELEKNRIRNLMEEEIFISAEEAANNKDYVEALTLLGSLDESDGDVAAAKKKYADEYAEYIIGLDDRKEISAEKILETLSQAYLYTGSEEIFSRIKAYSRPGNIKVLEKLRKSFAVSHDTELNAFTLRTVNFVDFVKKAATEKGGMLSAAISERDGEITFFLVLAYSTDELLGTEEMLFNCDGRIMSFAVKEAQREEKVIDLDYDLEICGIFDSQNSERYALSKLMDALSSAESITVTAKGQTRDMDYVIPRRQIDELMSVWRAYQVLKENPELFGEVYIESMENK